MKTETSQSSQTAPLGLVIAAFAAVYVIWGSTYLGIRYAVESIPPFLMAATRHLLAGVVLFSYARLRGAKAPTLAQWRDAAIAGTLMLVIGNGGVTWAEQMIPSGIAALLVALTPVWMVLIDWARPGGVRPRALVGLGLGIGIAGVVLLARKQMAGTGSAYGWGVMALLAASICWALGSVFNRTARKPDSAFLGVSMQMIAGGGVLLAISVLQGEARKFSFANVTALSFWSWLYLAIAGSLVAYTAYVWLLHASTPARVATYAYVNPLIAVLLGCTLGREAFEPIIYLAGGLIIVAVVLVLRGSTAKPAVTSATSARLLSPQDS
ncbi:MAG: EamA family transporter [Verrucomicrobiota bacterium]